MKKAFSLIELSIVVLIIGIIVAGVTQSSSLVRKMKLQTARSLTNSSAASSIQGMVLWLETTSEASFSTSYNNNDPISQWKDINPQQTSKSDAAQASSTLQPLYTENAIGGLPALKCDGVNDSLQVVSGPYYPTDVPANTNSFTIFLVATPTTTHEVDPQGNTGTLGTTNQNYVLGATQGSIYYGDANVAGMGISLGTNGVSIYEHSGNYMPAVAAYNSSAGLSSAAIIVADYNNLIPTLIINGGITQTGVVGARTTVFPSSRFCSGTYGAFSGLIGEIIVYNRHLNSEERKSVEKYLGQKWGIKVS